MLIYEPSTQSQFWVQTSAWDHYFTTFSGIKDQASTSQYPDGQIGRIFNLRGPRTVQPITLSVPFDPIRHADIVDMWKATQCDFQTIIVTPVTCGEYPEPLPGSRVLVIPDAQMTSLTFMNVDRSSANVAMMEIGFVANTYTYA